jgi:hypothetical protein
MLRGADMSTIKQLCIEHTILIEHIAQNPEAIIDHRVGTCSFMLVTGKN